MCLYLGKGKPTVLRAEKDIVCYKVLEEESGELYSPYITYFKWKLGKVVEVKLPLAKDGRKSDRNEINKGLHSYTTFTEAKENTSYHFYGKVFKAIIPKGSHYYVNARGTEYASSKLRIVKQL